MKPSLLICMAAAMSPLAAEVCLKENAALRLADSAYREVLAGNVASASQSLEEAAGMCPLSCIANGRVAAVYRIASLDGKARRYEASVDILCHKKMAAPIIVSTPKPGKPEPVTSSDKPASSVRQKFALVIGVGKFQDSRIHPLKFAAKDARDFAAILTDPDVGRFKPGTVTVLTDEQATTRNIRSALYEIAAKSLQEDLVVIYFSTHGSNPKTNQTKQASGFLVTYDTEAKNAQTLFATAYGMGELVRFVQDNLRAERTVILLDSCFSGDTNRIFSGSSAEETKGLELEDVVPVAQGKGSVVISSSTASEVSWESDEKQNSFFTLALDESMRKRKGKGTVTDLFTDIQYEIPASVQEYTRKKGVGDGITQTPVIYPKNNIPQIVIGAPVQ